jgi:hypothetical protein
MGNVMSCAKTNDKPERRNTPTPQHTLRLDPPQGCIYKTILTSAERKWSDY